MSNQSMWRGGGTVSAPIALEHISHAEQIQKRLEQLEFQYSSLNLHTLPFEWTEGFWEACCNQSIRSKLLQELTAVRRWGYWTPWGTSLMKEKQAYRCTPACLDCFSLCLKRGEFDEAAKYPERWREEALSLMKVVSGLCPISEPNWFTYVPVGRSDLERIGRFREYVLTVGKELHPSIPCEQNVPSSNTQEAVFNLRRRLACPLGEKCSRSRSEKQMLSTRKKLREIEKLEMDARDGKVLNPNQLAKMDKRKELQTLLAKLEASESLKQKALDITLLREAMPEMIINILQFAPTEDVVSFAFSTTAFSQYFTCVLSASDRLAALGVWQFRCALQSQIHLTFAWLEEAEPEVKLK